MSQTGEVWSKGIFTYKIHHDAHWMLIFEHNTEKGFFKNENDAEFSLQKQKFSYLKRLSNDYYVHRLDPKFEFLLEYPVDYPGQYNRWTQSKDPLLEQEYESDTTVPASGYSAVHLDWPDYFGGLVKSSSNLVLLDGITGHEHWWYSIGDYTSKTTTAGPVGYYVSYVNLWIRISKPFLPDYTCRNKLLLSNLQIAATLFLTF